MPKFEDSSITTNNFNNFNVIMMENPLICTDKPLQSLVQGLNPSYKKLPTIHFNSMAISVYSSFTNKTGEMA